jgi:hypothetical protein
MGLIYLVCRLFACPITAQPLNTPDFSNRQHSPCNTIYSLETTNVARAVKLKGTNIYWLKSQMNKQALSCEWTLALHWTIILDLAVYLQ